MPKAIDIRAYDQLRARGFHIERGWSDELAEQLVSASLEPEIHQYTPKDADERFVTVAAANEWHETKQPVVYALGRTAQLAGIIWFSHRPNPDIAADYTFAIRMYASARGKHLAQPFIEASEADFRETTHPQAIWLETDMDNSAARNLYRKIGYKVVAGSNARITMRR